jgi:methyltransferase (TIGR00027 family)
MRANRPSFTAEIVAIARALATDELTPHGKAARAILPRSARALVGLLEASFAKRHLPALARELIDHIALRCAILDTEIEKAIARELMQVVILGAGLDTRAHRLGCLADADVIEVDHPSSQAAKQKTARGLPQRARSLRYVAVDFEREALSTRLLQHGYDKSRPSVFVLEGVVPYLAREAIAETLTQIGDLAAPGSSLLLTYVPDGADWYERTRWLSDFVLNVAGEPLRSPLPREAIHAMVVRAGLRVASDSAPFEWVQALGKRVEGAEPIELERLLIARKG